MKMRVSPSDVDGFDYFMRAENMSVADFEARLRRAEPPTLKMRAGTAWHQFLEDSGEHEEGVSVVQQDGFTFVLDRLEGEVTLPRSREVWGRLELELPNGLTVEMRGKADGIDGLVGRDYKFTCGRGDMNQYASAYQWRIYSLMFGLQRFNYEVFKASQDRKDETTFYVHAFERLPLYAYPSMRADVVIKLAAFTDFLRANIWTDRDWEAGRTLKHKELQEIAGNKPAARSDDRLD